MEVFELSEALEATSGDLLARHLARSKEWFPHELVPWGLGRDCGPGAEPPPACPLPPGVASALFVNLLTEDNLPHYFHAIASRFADDPVMSAWARRWTAEEQRHSIAIRDWVCVNRQLDLVALERARMAQVEAGFSTRSRSHTISDGLVYLTLQELATRVSHRQTGQLLGDPLGIALMNRVAADENLHFLFYRDLTTAALAENPSEVVLAIDRQVTNFEMPGSEIAGFAAHAAAIAAAGIYDFRLHYEQVLVPVVIKHWAIESIEGLTPEAEAARDHVVARVARVGRVARRLEAQGVGAPSPTG